MEIRLITTQEGIVALDRLEGMVSASRVLPKGYDRDELLIDIGEVASTFVFHTPSWRNVDRALITPQQELRHAIVRAATERDPQWAAARLKDWLDLLEDPEAREVLFQC